MTTDYKILRAIESITEIAQSLNIEYLIFGSCGIQSYLPYFFRLPNDVDIVLREKDIQLFLNNCVSKKLKIKNELGRFKVYINDFPIHIIPEVFSIINKEDSSVFDKVSFSDAFENPSQNKLQLLYSDAKVIANVMPLDYIIFMELVRKQDTNTFYSLIALLSLEKLPMNRINFLIHEYPKLNYRIEQSLSYVSIRLNIKNSIFQHVSPICLEAILQLKSIIHKNATL